MTYGWACTDPDCNVTDPGPYTEAEADARRERHEATHGLPFYVPDADGQHSGYVVQPLPAYDSPSDSPRRPCREHESCEIIDRHGQRLHIHVGKPSEGIEPPPISDAEMFQALLDIAWFHDGNVHIGIVGTHGAQPCIRVTGEEPFVVDWPADRRRLIDYAKRCRSE